MRKVFLGGTCNGSTWRDEIKKILTADYFDPIVEDWNEEAQLEEERQKIICDIQLYVITPKMEGVYSIAEVVDSAWVSWTSKDGNDRRETVLCVLESDGSKMFSDNALKSLNAVKKLVEARGGWVFENLKDTTDFLNNI